MQQAKSEAVTPTVFVAISDAPIHEPDNSRLKTRHKLFKAILNDSLVSEIRYVVVEALMILRQDNVPSINDCIKDAIIKKYYDETLRSYSHRKASEIADEIYRQDLYEFVELIGSLGGHRDFYLDIQDAYQRAVMEIYTTTAIRKDGNDYRHVLDPAYTNMQNEQRWLLREIKDDPYYGPELQKNGLAGFKMAVDKNLSESHGEYFGLIRWYIEYFNLNDTVYGEEVVKHLNDFSQKSQPNREVLLSFYEENADILDPLLLQYPEYDFVIHGKYKRYRLVTNLAKDLDITMQDYLATVAFFKGLASGKANKSSSSSKKKAPSITLDQHKIALLSTFDHLNRVLLHRKLKTTILNIWPNDIKGRCQAQLVGLNIAIAFKYKSKWWILVDSLRQQSAVYLWTGHRLSQGLSLLQQARTYVRSSPGIKSRNHTPLICSYLDSYYRLFKDNGLDILE